MTDWNNPTLASTYATFLSVLKDRDFDAASCFLNAPTNPQTGMIRYVRASNKFQEWNGAAWVDKILSVAGGGTGAATIGDIIIALGLGTISIQDANNVLITGGSVTGVILNAANLVAGTIPIARFPTSGTWNINATLDVSGGPFTVRGFGFQVVNISATPYAPLITDTTIQVNSTTGNKIIALPTALSAIRRILVIQKTVAANTVTITPNGAETIDSVASLVLTGLLETVMIQSDGSNWYTIATKSNLSSAYPIGSLYINTAVSTNPNTLLGFGTWAAFGTGRVLVGIDGSQAEFDTLGETGGAKTHTLITAEMPSHNHIQDPHRHSVFTPNAGGGFNQLATTGGDNSAGNNLANEPNAVQNVTATNQNAGGGGAHNNLQPYITVYMWTRTA